MRRGLVIVLALGIDLLFGELPNRWHPVAAMGRLVGKLEARAPGKGALRQFIYGGMVESICLTAAIVPSRIVQRLLPARSLVGALAEAVALKPTFALRDLFLATDRVRRPLEQGDLEGARQAVGQLVSRDVSALDESEVAAAAVETLAENASDSVVAPLLLYAAFGLPGAYGYRMANTLDAMIGYRGRYEYTGKVAARLDDLLNLLPSRLTALATVIAARPVGTSPADAWRGAVEGSHRTASPNAGWPMGAAAGALGLRLEKAGHYVLNPVGKRPTSSDVPVAQRLVGAGLAVAIVGTILVASRSAHHR
ncbi:MAG TPA: adenosylcobinamide-phosphate synthase CbiB [Chloroflexota bacterium]|nr:adenosylcobinamide-phosphate synthase CbiB [Chloroflexota bacterium]